jgi:hypothetical protein
LFFFFFINSDSADAELFAGQDITDGFICIIVRSNSDHVNPFRISINYPHP